ncbi:hypothetical protein CCYA_CCYA07G2168 [Cyanidiococcus yangmingshanensis]|nr:hypothetical protein CCYA_CCYA07G2168 [Cyanidiococcus yangmingshanensis]
MQYKSSVRVLVFKGFPGVGKTTLSRAVAKRLAAPRFDKDDFKDVLYGANILPEERCNELSKQLLNHLVAEQVQLGVPFIVVDAPFRLRADLEALLVAIRGKLRPASSALPTSSEDHPRLVEVRLVNCRLRDEVEWKRRIEHRASEMTPAGGHRPRTWEAVQKLQQQAELFEEADGEFWLAANKTNWGEHNPPDGIRILAHEMDMSSPALDVLLGWCGSSAMTQVNAPPCE